MHAMKIERSEKMLRVAYIGYDADGCVTMCGILGINSPLDTPTGKTTVKIVAGIDAYQAIADAAETRQHEKCISAIESSLMI